MKPIPFEQQNHVFYSPAGIEEVEPLPVYLDADTRTIMSVWMPTEEEKQRIADGHPVLLWVWGTCLPPVAVGVAE